MYYLNYIKDVLGNNYLGLNIPNDTVQPYLDQLKSILGEEDYQIFTQNQIERDGGVFHITVFNVMEYNGISKRMGFSNFINSLELVFEYEIDDLEMLGIGKASKGDNTAYFVVCQSDKLDAVRDRYALPKRDFHITLGFNKKDVFGIPKNEIIK